MLTKNGRNYLAPNAGRSGKSPRKHPRGALHQSTRAAQKTSQLNGTSGKHRERVQKTRRPNRDCSGWGPSPRGRSNHRCTAPKIHFRCSLILKKNESATRVKESKQQASAGVMLPTKKGGEVVDPWVKQSAKFVGGQLVTRCGGDHQKLSFSAKRSRPMNRGDCWDPTSEKSRCAILLNCSRPHGNIRLQKGGFGVTHGPVSVRWISRPLLDLSVGTGLISRDPWPEEGAPGGPRPMTQVFGHTCGANNTQRTSKETIG